MDFLYFAILAFEYTSMVWVNDVMGCISNGDTIHLDGLTHDGHRVGLIGDDGMPVDLHRYVQRLDYENAYISSSNLSVRST
jgi:hypothetical protein